jgi:cell cycle checkpoint protein
MGIDSAISFLTFHSPDFFTDITELSRSYDLMSDSDTFVHQLFDGRQDGPFPMDYAASIGGRAVAHANIHPAPPKFRQFSAPKVFGVMKKKRENETKIEHLRRRLSTVGRGGVGGADDRETTSIRGNIGSANQFVTESLPYFRIVIPQGTDAPCYVRIRLLFTNPRICFSFFVHFTRCQHRSGQLPLLRQKFR